MEIQPLDILVASSVFANSPVSRGKKAMDTDSCSSYDSYISDGSDVKGGSWEEDGSSYASSDGEDHHGRSYDDTMRSRSRSRKRRTSEKKRVISLYELNKGLENKEFRLKAVGATPGAGVFIIVQSVPSEKTIAARLKEKAQSLELLRANQASKKKRRASEDEDSGDSEGCLTRSLDILQSMHQELRVSGKEYRFIIPEGSTISSRTVIMGET